MLERASLYALGTLSPQESFEFERHLNEGCAECARELSVAHDTAAQLAYAADASAPRPELLRELLSRVGVSPAREYGEEIQVWRSWQPSETEEGMNIVRGGEGGWTEVMPGVRAKQLYVDPMRQSVTMLVRMEPGTSYPAHRHGGPEQCFVIEGDIHVGDAVLRGGDFQCVDTDSIHGVQSTEGGCLLLIVSSQKDELLT
jgi:anti-sigma factor ChrR (cupin superfamily)